MIPMGVLQGKVAIVTGGGRGIGRATALRLAQDGAKVVINDLDEIPAQEAVALINQAGGVAAAMIGNISLTEDANALIQFAVEKFGGVDILVNNAGLTRDAMIHRMSDEQFNLVLDVCLRGTFNCSRAAATYMREVSKREKSEGKQVHRKMMNVTSLSGIHGAVGNVNYSAAKAAVIGITKSLARELAPFRINVNAVAPGFIDTRLTGLRDETAKRGVSEEIREKIISRIPLGRAGQPEDVAGVMSFLASPDSDFITGQVIQIDGGLEFIDVV